MKKEMRVKEEKDLNKKSKFREELINEEERFKHFFLLDSKKIIKLMIIALVLFIVNASVHNPTETLQLIAFIVFISLAVYIASAVVFTLFLILIEKNIIAKLKLKIKYPKFLLLIITFILAYFIFKSDKILPFITFLDSWDYLGDFLAGTLFTYGFTTGPAIAIFLLLAENQNILIASLIGGFGALIGDIIIFKLIRTGFNDEVKLLEHELIIRYLDKKIPNSIKKYILPVIGGLILASPLPDEIGVAMLAMLKNVSSRVFYIISYIMNTLGIFVIMWIGKGI